MISPRYCIIAVTAQSAWVGPVTFLSGMLHEATTLKTLCLLQALHAWYEDQLLEPEEAAAPKAGSPAKRQRAGTTAGGGGPPSRGTRSGMRTRAADTELVPDSESEAASGRDCGEGRADSCQSACSDGVPHTLYI